MCTRIVRDAGRGALPRDRRRTSHKHEHGLSGHHRSPITESEKMVLRRAAPVARERAPTGATRNQRHSQASRNHAQ